MVLKQSIPSEQIDIASDMFKALANPQRLAIVCALLDGEKAVHELERDLGIRQPNLSQHLASLRDSDFVETRRDGRSILYSLTPDRATLVAGTLQGMFAKPARPRSPSAMVARRRPPLERSPDPRTEAAVFARLLE